MFESAEAELAISKDEYEGQVPGLRVDLLNAQYDLREADFPVILLIAGDDRVGCNEVLNLLHEWMDARFLVTRAFGPPSDEEAERPLFWRYWRELPPNGRIGVYFGAWVLSAVAERIAGRIGDDALERHAAHVCRFEQALVDDGALLLKFWLHLPKRELKKRLKRAKKRGRVSARVDDRDWELCEVYDEAVPVAERLLRLTSTAAAPWEVVASADARYRNLAVARALLSALARRLDASKSGRPADRSNPELEVLAETSALDAVDLTASLERDEYRKKLEKQQARLRRLAGRARKQGISSVLVFEGWDAAGKGGVIRRISHALDARDYRMAPIGPPSDEEKSYHYLWRFWRQLPRAGQILIFDRSWYGRVLVERVEGFAREDEWRRAYAEIVDFETQLALHGMLVLKFWLHIDPHEQMRRFKDREATPYKKHKITDEDYRNRERWGDYVAAIDEMVARTSTDLAPWLVVPANDKRWARVEVLRSVCDGLKRVLKQADD